MAALPSNPDIVIVGAGAAGIGAGRALLRLGIPFLILEGSERVGGRAHTDTTTFGHLFDHGCHWFHSADINPLRHIAEAIGHGFSRERRFRARPICVDGRWVGETEREEIDAAVWGLFDDVYAAGRDVAVSEVVDFSGRLGPLRRHWFELMSSVAPEDTSALDYARYEDTGVNLPVRDGYGALIKRLAEDLPVRLGSPVTGLETKAEGVRVSGPFGSVDARAAIVTASLGVLASGSIAFEPGLDAGMRDAIENVRLGTYEKTVIAFDRPFLCASAGFEQHYGDILDPSDPADVPLNFELEPFGRPLAIAHLAGRSLDDVLAHGGRRALADLVEQKIVRGFGADARRRIVGRFVTDWCDNPHVRGGYGAARPGKARSRDRLVDGTVTDRMLLAGEASHPQWPSTAHGAYLSGIDRAHRLARLLGREALPPDPLWLGEAVAA